ncbi:MULTISPECIES: hypothetical protein [unclassified Flavobacterium]|uniref:hypothetical protein n=1 Tax=unclassified Flavobacterium TaxID=196869 RepID=UPI00129253FE|nr:MULTISPECIES: hypothetical protein [unclassified Flavobacterium]MQP53425.1 hypothetical protein [Flavobacterium sp. LMO9]MQP63471.1 hypothetical protein [Flavobacterium sp. LMO6]
MNIISEFPKKFIGTYAVDTLHGLVIEPKCTYLIQKETITALKSELDSIPELEFRNNQVYDKSENKFYKTFRKGDSVSFTIERIDTIFSFAKNEIAKAYKSSLILNEQVDGKYQTNILKLTTSGVKYITLGTKNDFTKLQSELKIPFETIMEENDTVHVVLTPSRADFRKLLRKEGFDFESNFLFK